MVGQGFGGVVIFMADVTLVPLAQVNGLMLYLVRLVHRAEIAVLAAIELSRVLSHVCVEISCR